MVKFGIIGDMGTGGQNQYKIARIIEKINRRRINCHLFVV